MYQTVRRNILIVLDALQILLPLRAFYNHLRYWLSFGIRRDNRRFLNNGIPDRLPFPTPMLTHLVGGNYSLPAFYHNGKEGASCISSILKKNGLEIGGFSSIYDFGCGCGRIMRHWHALEKTKRFGSDYNPLLIEWCRQSLTFAEFSVNPLAGKTIYRNEQFDFIYTISVFTHLIEPMQLFWINELKRVLKPGGYIYLTTLGTTHRYRLSPREQELYDAGNLIIRQEHHPGKNFCLAFHPDSYFRKNMCGGFTIVDYIPGGATDAARQDVYLLKKNITE